MLLLLLLMLLLILVLLVLLLPLLPLLLRSAKPVLEPNSLDFGRVVPRRGCSRSRRAQAVLKNAAKIRQEEKWLQETQGVVREHAGDCHRESQQVLGQHRAAVRDGDGISAMKLTSR